MARTTTPITPGDGAEIVVDEVDNELIQVIKLDGGAEGESLPIVAGRADEDESLPVVLSEQDLAVLAALATSAKQDTEITALQAILAKIVAAPATESKQDAIIAALASILAKLLAAPATEAKQDTGNTSLGSIVTALTSQATATKQDTIITAAQAILAKLIAAPSTESKQDAIIAALASILAKLLAAPATESKQDTGNTSLGSIVTALTSQATATKQDTLITAAQAILAKIIVAPATEAKQGGIYLAAPSALTDGLQSALLLTAARELRVSNANPSKWAYTPFTDLAITLAALATSATLVAGQQGPVFDANGYEDIQVSGRLRVGTTPTVNTRMELWVSGSIDGTIWPDSLVAIDAAKTWTTAGIKYLAARQVCFIDVLATTSNVTFPIPLTSIRALFDGTLPQKLIFWVGHNTGVNLHATPASHAIHLTGVRSLYAA